MQPKWFNSSVIPKTLPKPWCNHCIESFETGGSDSLKGCNCSPLGDELLELFK